MNPISPFSHQHGYTTTFTPKRLAGALLFTAKARRFQQALVTQQDTVKTNNCPTHPPATSTANPIQSAFFGLDNGIGRRNPQDGLVVSFAQPIDGNTLNPNDFEVVDAAGNRHTPRIATLSPANEAGENRSVLLLGEFGTAGSNPVASVRIVGDLYTQQGTSSYQPVTNLRGVSTTDIIPLSAGPSLFHAETLPLTQSEFPNASGQVVQVAWQGGITPLSDTVSEADLFQYYTVYTDAGDGHLTAHTPYAIGDINDNDNYHQLLVATNAPIVKVTMAAGIVQDPNGDPNPETVIFL